MDSILTKIAKAGVMAVVAGVDVLIVCTLLGMAKKAVTRGETFRLAALFGGFHMAAGGLGWLMGMPFGASLAESAHWIVLAILAYFSLKTFLEYRRAHKRGRKLNIFRGAAITFIAAITSLDAILAGFGLAVWQVNIISTTLALGVVACALTIAGFSLGMKLESSGTMRESSEETKQDS